MLRTLGLLQQLTDGEHELGSGDLDRLGLEHRLTEAAGPEPCVDHEGGEELHEGQPHAEVQDVRQRSVTRAFAGIAGQQCDAGPALRHEQPSRNDGIIGLIEMRVREQRRSAHRNDPTVPLRSRDHIRDAAVAEARLVIGRHVVADGSAGLDTRHVL